MSLLYENAESHISPVPEMVSRPALSSVQVKFSPQVPEFTIALSSASTVVPSEIVIMIANSKLKILFLIAFSPSISFI